MKYFTLIIVCTLFLLNVAKSQGLEGVIVEKYYITTQADADAYNTWAVDNLEKSGDLPVGATTYRVYLDLATGYSLTAAYGSSTHQLFFRTTTFFWNSGGGGIFPSFTKTNFARNMLGIDSYLSIGAACNGNFGVLKSEDDGVAQPTNWTANTFMGTDSDMGISPRTQDGLLSGAPQSVTLVGLDAITPVLDDGSANNSEMVVNNGAWSTLTVGGAFGPTSSNRLLIGQFTTDGEFSFELNVQLGKPSQLGYSEQFVSRNATGQEQLFSQLIYPSVPGCTIATACNYNPNATSDDGTCLIPEPGCSVCDGELLDLIDADGDGVCDPKEVPGCTNPVACNYSALATDDNGTCILAELNCTECQDGDTVKVDSDGDGICDKYDIEIPGCMDNLACNYVPAANVDNNSCLYPVEGCTECADGLVVDMDTDGDGIRDCDEIPGCQQLGACNYNAEATDPAECFIPIANCRACNSTNTGTDIIDDDGDGICNASEMPGCMKLGACNYFAGATDSAECFIPKPNCLECNENNNGLDSIDTDNDGICDAEDVSGWEDLTFNEEVLTIYPNPAEGQLTIELAYASARSRYTYKLNDIAGKTLLNGSLTAEGSTMAARLNLSAVRGGVYVVHISSPEGYNAVRQLIIK